MHLFRAKYKIQYLNDHVFLLKVIHVLDKYYLQPMLLFQLSIALHLSLVESASC